MFRHFITWILEKVRPAPPLRNRLFSTRAASADRRPTVQDAGDQSPRDKANSISTSTGSTTAEETDLFTHIDWDPPPDVDGRRLYAIWPRSTDRKETDRIYENLVPIFGADAIEQTGGIGGSKEVVFWRMRATEDEITRVRELESADSVRINVCPPCPDPT